MSYSCEGLGYQGFDDSLWKTFRYADTWKLT